MGSPYIISTISTVSTIRSLRGYRRVLDMVKKSMGYPGSPKVAPDGTWIVESPEDVVIMRLSQEVIKSVLKRDRRIITLQATYDWLGWEKFQRSVVIDFTHPARDDEKSYVVTARSIGNEAFKDASTGGEGHLWESASWL